MGSMNNERDPQILRINVGTLGTTVDTVVPGIYFRKRSRIKNVHLINQAAIAADPTQHVVVTLQSNAGSPVSYAAVDTKDSAAVANTPLALVPTTPVGDLANQPEVDVPAGTTLNVRAVTAGTAVTTLAVVQIEWYPL